MASQSTVNQSQPLREAFRVFLGDIPCYREKFQEQTTDMQINIAVFTDGYKHDPNLKRRLDTLIAKAVANHPKVNSACGVSIHLAKLPAVCNLSKQVHQYLRTSSAGFTSYHSHPGSPAQIRKQMLDSCQYAIFHISNSKRLDKMIGECRKRKIKFHVG